MKVTARTHMVGIALYSLPFLAVIGFSWLVMWAGHTEMIVAGVALLPVIMYFFGARWSRYVVGVFSAVSFLVCTIVPFPRGTEGRYFWMIWTPIWLLFAFSALISFIPVRQTPRADQASSGSQDSDPAMPSRRV